MIANNRANNVQGDTVKSYLKRFPGMATRALSRKIYGENKALWKSVESVNALIRYYRGTHGASLRAKIATRTHLKTEPETFTPDPFDDLPEPSTEYATPWKPFEIVGAHRALVLSDIHFPYYDKTALKVAMNHGKKRGSDLIILNGDTADCHSISRFEKDPRSRNFASELKMIAQFLEVLRETFRKARIIWKDGNHDEWYNAYLIKKAEELIGIEKFKWENVLGLKDHGIEYVTDKRTIMAGKLPLIHGHEYKTGFAAPVNPARGFFLRAKRHVLGGHHHQTSQHSEKALGGEVISTWSTGCLSQLNPRYNPNNNYNHGFADIEIATGGDFRVDNKKILNGEIY